MREALSSNNMSQSQFFHLAIPENGTTTQLQTQCGHWNWGGHVSSSMPFWLWVIWRTATEQLCPIIIFNHTESRISFSTHKTYQVQSTSEQRKARQLLLLIQWEGNGVGGRNAWEADSQWLPHISLFGFCMFIKYTATYQRCVISP